MRKATTSMPKIRPEIGVLKEDAKLDAIAHENIKRKWFCFKLKISVAHELKLAPKWIIEDSLPTDAPTPIDAAFKQTPNKPSFNEI